MTVSPPIKTFARSHPVLTFLLINFGWTWLFWFGAIPFREQELLTSAIVLIGGFGPALAGVLTLALGSGKLPDWPVRRVLLFALMAGLVFSLLALRYLNGGLAASAPVIAALLAASLVAGCFYSTPATTHRAVRERMGSLLPWRTSAGWSILALVFFPLMILAAWGLAELFGLDLEYPARWGEPFLAVLPGYALTFTLTALAQGGNEEPGWRGLMQPALQNRFSPLVASLIVSLFWSLWHLPLFLNGFYAGDLVGGMLSGGIYRVLLAIFLAWYYNRSGGNLFAMIVLHASFNQMVNFLPTSNLGLLVMWLLVVLVIVVKDKMYKRVPNDTPQARTESFAGSR